MRRAGNHCGCRPGSSRSCVRLHEILEQYLEAQVVAAGYAKTLVAIGKRLVLASASVAAALVPGDQFLALHDHGHAHRAAMPFVARHALGRSEERRVGKECRSRWSPYH